MKKITKLLTKEDEECANYLFALYSQIPAYFTGTSVDNNVLNGVEHCIDGYMMAVIKYKGEHLSRVDELNYIIIDSLMDELKKRDNSIDYEHLAILLKMKDFIINSSSSLK